MSTKANPADLELLDEYAEIGFILLECGCLVRASSMRNENP